MLQVIPRAQAVACVREKAGTITLCTEHVDLQHALHRVLAQDIVAAENIPPFDRTTVDGYAVCAADTYGAGDAIPAMLDVVGEIRMGETAAFTLQRGQCARISTGGMLPAGADAAVMVERTEEDGETCLVYASVAPGANVTKAGDDLHSGAVALQQGTRIGFAQIGVLASLGIYEVPVYKKPVVAVISTGDELVTGTPQGGQMRDVNSFLLAAAAAEYGCEIECYGAVKDDRTRIETALADCLQKADMVLISGGSSAGTHDMTVDILETLGTVFFHGIAMKPGKPTIFGMAQGKPVFGLPGHPLAAYFVFRLIVCEVLREWLHLAPDRPIAKLPLAVNIPSNHGREEFLCVERTQAGTVVPLHTKSGLISVLSKTAGFLQIPRDAEGLTAGTIIELYGYTI